MKFSEMKLVNSVKSYFQRDWSIEDMTNFEEISEDVHRNLKKVYLTLFCAMLCSTFGSILHWIWDVGGLFTVLSSVTSSLLLYFTPPGRVRTRVLLTMLAACSFGASVGIFTNLCDMEQRFLVRLLAGKTFGCAIFLFVSMLTKERSEIYFGCLRYCYVLMLTAVSVIAFNYWDRPTALWTVKIHAVLTLFMGYFVVYSQEILYNAQVGDINFVNSAFNVFFHLPGIAVHAVRLYLHEAIEQQGHN